MPSLTDLIGPAGPLEALLDQPSTGTHVRAAVVFAHPHPQFGGTMHTKAVYQGAKGSRTNRVRGAPLQLPRRRVAVPASSTRARERRPISGPPSTIWPTQYPNTPLWAAGFSFGSWVALEVGAEDPRVSVLIGIAPPVATSVSGQVYTFEATLASTKPKFFVQGEADEVCPIEGMWGFYGKLHEPKELVVIDMANHLFEGHAAEVGEALEDLLQDFGDTEEGRA